ncbi:efflux RND transporter periplasmic adaptor subunit, partial [Tychonema sp. LEGE 07196]|nr:efflux RND transporter periplasmic adaptor subunit [Tychonema sp. LEGE 07196]
VGGGIAIASLTFAAGVFWGNRRKFPVIADAANNSFSISKPAIDDELLHNDNHHVKSQEAEVKISK